VRTIHLLHRLLAETHIAADKAHHVSCRAECGQWVDTAQQVSLCTVCTQRELAAAEEAVRCVATY
jgi:hypothetical protein